MGMPSVNVKVTYDGSPINFAEGLQGHLLLIHAPATTTCIFRDRSCSSTNSSNSASLRDDGRTPTARMPFTKEGNRVPRVHHALVALLEEHVPPGGVAR